MERDPSLERELLDRTKAPNDFASQVLARLDHYEAKHGNTGWDQDVDELLAEIEEECADVAGWGMGAAQKLTETERHRLVVAMSLGAAAWREIRELREQLATGRG